jgi:deoxyribonuclease-4
MYITYIITMTYKNIGYHISIANIKNTIKQLEEDKVKVCQIFISSNLSFNKCTFSPETLEYFKTETKRLKVKVFIHGPYVINLSNILPENIQRCKSVIINQLYIANVINAKGVVIHMGKSTTQTMEVGINNFVMSVKKILTDYHGKAKLILETSAGQGTEICSNIKEFAKMFNQFNDDEKKKLGICIDTCHVFAAGYDLSSKKKAKAFYELIIKYIDINSIACIHLNDSKCDVGCKKDRHDDLGYGKIGIDGLKYIYKKFNKNKIPLILETPTTNASYIDQIKAITS